MRLCEQLCSNFFFWSAIFLFEYIACFLSQRQLQYFNTCRSGLMNMFIPHESCVYPSEVIHVCLGIEQVDAARDDLNSQDKEDCEVCMND